MTQSIAALKRSKSNLDTLVSELAKVAEQAHHHILGEESDWFDKISVNKNMKSLKRILKPNGVITAQVGSQDKKPKQADSWLKVFNKNFGNTTLDRVYIPSFDCSWNFSSSINH